MPRGWSDRVDGPQCHCHQIARRLPFAGAASATSFDTCPLDSTVLKILSSAPWTSSSKTVDDVSISTNGSFELQLQHLPSVFIRLHALKLYIGTKHIYAASHYAPALGYVAGKGRILIPADRVRDLPLVTSDDLDRPDLRPTLSHICSFFLTLCTGIL